MSKKVKNGRYVDEDGTVCWYKDDGLHREDGPAVESPDGSKHWFLNDKLHREDGPAIEWSDGSKEWYLDGQRHRLDGPAIEYLGVYKAWYKNGQFHREDGPAYESANGAKEWWLSDTKYTEKEYNQLKKKPIEKNNEVKNGRYEDGSGNIRWYKDGELHREDGPAFDFVNGTKSWYLDGVQYTEEQFNQWLAKKELNENFHHTPEEKPSVRKVKI